MALTTLEKDKLQDIADAIRQKKSSLNTMTPGQMPAEILSIPTTTPSQTKSITYSSNDTYTVYPDPGYLLSSAEVQVNVPQTPVQTKSQTIDTNGSYTIYPDTGYNLEAVNLTVAVPSSGKPEQTKSVAYHAQGNYTITPDTGYTLGQVDVEVAVWNSVLHTSILENGIQTISAPTGTFISAVELNVNVQPSTQTKSATYMTNGNYTITPESGYYLTQANVEVAVPAPVTQAKTETYTINGTYTISPDSGYDYLTGATVNVQVPAASANFARHRFQTSSGGTASWTMDAMTVGESRIQDLVFYYPTMQVTANYKAYLPSTGTYSVQSWGSSNVETKNGGDLIESHTYSYNSSKSGDIGAASTWVVTRLT